ncbi:MAG TPA: septal ring lytic transglycosylase RlpA family protein [Candidatus Omnitrophota bacterium]|nr:septal ring lytic transglycosylase RlpA family protein [Candidatus Omnitrophota bacterium]
MGRVARTAAALALLTLAACAERAPPPDPIPPPEPRPRAELSKPRGHYKIGPPYRINGVLYVPKLDYGYQDSGTASWYGNSFHGKLTANGERFDENDLSAAHQTLPLPSLVRVTNLDNGRSLTLRVNDRGPFVAGRILDVSKKAAKMLGFHGRGTARVRVMVLEKESRALAAKYGIRHPEPEEGKPSS